MISLTYAGPLKLGDQISLSHLPENIYLHTGEKVVDKTGLMVFDYNPYVIRDYKGETESIDIWRTWMDIKGDYPTLAHKQCQAVGVKCKLISPRLYLYEGLPKLYKSYVIHTTSSRASIPQYVINHIRDKYSGFFFQIGSKGDVDANVFDRRGCSFWESAKLVAESEIFFGLDSGPMWLSLAYNIRRKIILAEFSEKELENWHPRYYNKGGTEGWYPSFGCEFYNIFTEDIGITKRFTDI